MSHRHHPLVLLLFVLHTHAEDSRIFNILDFGATPDGETSNTASFVSAVSEIRKNGGGTLLIPRGRWLTGPFNLTSRMTLFLDDGAIILGSIDLAEWPLMPAMPSYGQGRDHRGPRRVSLVHGFNLHDIAIRGNNGTIDGQGPFWWKRHSDHRESYTRGHLVEFINCSDIVIQDVTLRDSPFWTVHPVYSRRIAVRRLTIINDYIRNGACDEWHCSGCNTDGFDPDSSSDILLEDSYFNVGDDGVAIKSGWDCFGWKYSQPSHNITIRNLTVVSPTSAGVCIGSEMSGGVSDVRVVDSTFINCSTGIRIKSGRSRSGYIKNLTYENINMFGTLSAAIEINAFYGSHNPSCPIFGPKAPSPVIDNIRIAHIRAESNQGFSMDLEGLIDAPTTNVFFTNVSVTGKGLAYKCSGGVVGHAESTHPIPPDGCGLNGRDVLIV